MSGWRNLVFSRFRLVGGLADFAERGFALNRPVSRAALEGHARSFLYGFNTAMADSPIGHVHARLGSVEPEERGFAFEGAGMACALMDGLLLSRGRRTKALLSGPGDEHPYVIHVGAGWALARLRYPGAHRLLGLDPLLGWLALDGWGFSLGFFGDRRALRRHRSRGPLRGPDAVRCQGMGRSLWFIESADPESVAVAIDAAPPEHRPHLWSGVGLAATYAGGATGEELGRLAELSAGHRAHVAQGAAFAAEARRRAGHVPGYTREAVCRLTGVDVDTAADWTQKAAASLSGDGTVQEFLLWRREIRRLAGAE
ncbi:DUF1702 family protein [Nonomuraea spiralis]|uniref:DUF1702 family protein n=1 Tax=Nonomuraea TaxID=83681 RepID=UPI000F7B7923|nr:DUF1702 family protein [Nonomuraea sp. WAC 01424]RSN15687.1 hypothetical protein DMB42_02495 [Nonomuraea sp. WAC 01424]